MAIFRDKYEQIVLQVIFEEPGEKIYKLPEEIIKCKI